MRKSNILIIIISIILGFTSLKANSEKKEALTIDLEKAEQFFAEAKSLSDKDNKKLWGKEIYGPLIFVDKKTRFIVTNEPDKKGKFKKQGSLYIGELPEKFGPSNSSIKFSGKKWSIIIWEDFVKSDRFNRNQLMMHELWHRIQEDIGFPGNAVRSNHLNELWGRILIKLEWRALQKALTSLEEEKIESIKDALIFRNYRRSLFENAEFNENKGESHEGLAEYTGLVLSGFDRNRQLEHVFGKMKTNENAKSLLLMWAYPSGASYCFLLDDLNINWRKDSKSPVDLGKLLQKAINFDIPENIEKEAEKRYIKYNGDLLITKEIETEKEIQKLITKYTETFVNNKIISFPGIGLNITFDPRETFSLKDHGTIYKASRITDVWGIIEVSEGEILINDGWEKLILTADNLNISSNAINGKGWNLKLKKSWKIKETESGNYTIKIKLVFVFIRTLIFIVFPLTFIIALIVFYRKYRKRNNLKKAK